MINGVYHVAVYIKGTRMFISYQTVKIVDFTYSEPRKNSFLWTFFGDS